MIQKQNARFHKSKVIITFNFKEETDFQVVSTDEKAYMA